MKLHFSTYSSWNCSHAYIFLIFPTSGTWIFTTCIRRAIQHCLFLFLCRQTPTQYSWHHYNREHSLSSLPSGPSIGCRGAATWVGGNEDRGRYCLCSKKWGCFMPSYYQKDSVQEVRGQKPSALILFFSSYAFLLSVWNLCL